jgi:uncharacterized circularly permuted ATP-grasp superfamily protein
MGNVTLANAVGNGVADDKLVYTYIPDLIRYYLSEDPIIPNVDTLRLEEPEALAQALDTLDQLVVKPVDGSGGKGLVVGANASPAQLDELRATLRANPRGWIAQPIVQLSTIPTLVAEGIRPRHSDLRPFAVNSGDEIWVLPGGLTRVALPEGQLVVNSSQGGGSKDTWVLDEAPAHPSQAAAPPLDDAVQPPSGTRGQPDGAVQPGGGPAFAGPQHFPRDDDRRQRYRQQIEHQQQAGSGPAC